MHKTRVRVSLVASLLSPLLFLLPTIASADTVYNAVPNPLAPNYPSQPFQAQQTTEYGDSIHLGGTGRLLQSVTVTMSDWALASTPANIAFCAANAANCDATGFNWPITLNIYSTHLGANGAPDTLLATKTVTQHIAWRPENAGQTACSTDSTAWSPDGTNCYHGYATNITFDMSSSNVTLPNDVIVSLVYNTQTYGPSPTGVDGPYNSLNIATPDSDPVTVGSDASTTSTFWNTSTAAWYADGGAAGVGIFRQDTGEGVNGTIAMQINTVTPTVNTVVVTPSDMQGWSFINDQVGGAGTGAMVTGPSTPPLGTGSAQLTATSSTDGQLLAVGGYLGIKLADITKLSYASYQSSSNTSNATAIALQFNVDKDVTDADTSFQGRLVFEPYINNGGTVPLGSWNTWDALNGGNGKWWLSHSSSQFNNNCSQASPCTVNQLLALYPNIGINANPALGGLIFKAGSGWTSFSGNVDALSIGTSTSITTYDFDPAPAPTTAKVTIYKYIDGQHATVSNANNATFPFTATYNASNIGSGSDPFTIGATGNNVSTGNPYEVQTIPLALGATYSASENVTGNDVVGASCSDGKPFALAGYSSGDNLAQALVNASSSTVAPQFRNLQSDKVIIVWNKTCAVTPPAAPQVHIFKFVDGVQATAQNNTATFPMNASWVSSTLGTVPSVGFTLSPAGWGASDVAYEASYVGGAAGDNYATNEVLTTPVVGAECDGSHTYALAGYTTGDTLADAQAATPNPASPSFTNLQSDKYVIVWNKTCPTTGSLTVTKSSIGGNGTFNFTSDIPGHESFQITTTNNQGSITFDGLTPGDYHVTEVNQPTGWTQTDTSCDDVSLAAGQAQTCVVTDTNNRLLGSIRGSKFEDWDGDGSPFETRWEKGLQGWTIYIDKNNNGQLDSGEPTATTNNSGLYIFSGLTAGTYTIREVQQTGWTQTYPSTNAMNDKWVVTLAAGQNVKKKDFGNFKMGSISGMKYNDLNGNGRKDANEPGIQGITINLRGPRGFTASTVTASDGSYSFSGLTAGNYTLSEVVPTGWHQTQHPSPVHIVSATNATNENFGNTQKSGNPHGHGWGDREGDNDNSDN